MARTGGNDDETEDTKPVGPEDDGEDERPEVDD